jgi:predicted DNA-binding ribbon-helix-helix protein
MMMCRLLAGSEAQDFRPVSRSIRIGGHTTSLRLEMSFWRALDKLAQDQGLRTPKLVELLHTEATELLRGEATPTLNLASILRTVCLLAERSSRT